VTRFRSYVEGWMGESVPKGPVSSLMVEFLTWVSNRPRTYAEAMEAWRSSCPRHCVWEDALCDGLIQIGRGGSTGQAAVTLTARGRACRDGH
jgi:hypothetical protein